MPSLRDSALKFYGRVVGDGTWPLSVSYTHLDVYKRQVDGHVVAAEERNMLATSFHPELTEERSVHAYFADKARAYAARR